MRQANLPVGLRFGYKTYRLSNHSKALIHNAENIKQEQINNNKKETKKGRWVGLNLVPNDMSELWENRKN